MTSETITAMLKMKGASVMIPNGEPNTAETANEAFETTAITSEVEIPLSDEASFTCFNKHYIKAVLKCYKCVL